MSMYTEPVMLLQTNSYVVPKDKRNEHARLVRRFRQSLAKLGCEHFEVYEQVSQNWGGQDSGGRFVQIMRFRDRRHQLDVQAAERTDPAAQALIQEFCELINFPFQQQQGLFAVGFYSSVLPTTLFRETVGDEAAAPEAAEDAPAEAAPQPAISPQPAPTSASSPERETANPEPRPALRPTLRKVAPIFFESTVAEPKPPSPPDGPRLVDDEMDSGLTDLSDSHLMNLSELPPAEMAFSDEQHPREPEVTASAAASEPAERQDVAAIVERAGEQEQEIEGPYHINGPNGHLEGHDDIEPRATEDVAASEERHDREHDGSAMTHSHVGGGHGDLSEEHHEELNVELFEPEAPVSPFDD